MTQDAAALAEELARAAYGRLLAILAARDGDIEAAEDCLAELLQIGRASCRERV